VYLLTAIQALANRTHYLNKLANDVTERTFTVSPFAASYSSGWTVSGSTLLGTSNNAELRLHLDFLPNGAVLKRVRALVTPGANVMGMALRYRTNDFITPGTSDTGVETGIASSGTSLQVMTTSLLSETIARASGNNHVAYISANSGAGASNDTLWGFQVVADLTGIGAF
jgi:hypothetical protein